MLMSNKSLTEEELRQWVLSLPPSSIRSLEDTLKGIRDCHFISVEKNIVKNEGDSVTKDTSDLINDIDVSPPSRTTSPTSSNVSIQSRSRSGKTYENGRRNLKEEEVSTEEANRRAKRRERNRLAAAKCRKRRQDKIDTLQHRVAQLKSEMDVLFTGIDQNSSEQDRLNNIISTHKCSIHQHSSSATRPNDLKIEQTLKPPSNNVFICSLSPQLINLSPLLSPSTMKLLIETLNGQHSDSSSNLTFKEESLQNSTIDSTFFTTISTPSNHFANSLGLLNLMSPNTDLLNRNLLSTPSLKIAASLASSIIKENQSTPLKHNEQA